MYKKILIALSILILTTSNAMASETEQYSQAASSAVDSAVTRADVSANQGAGEQKKRDTADKLNKKLSKKKKLKKADDFKVITDCSTRARKGNVAAYVSFVCENDFSDDYLEVFNRILQNGTTIQSLEEVYEFWLTTDEDFSVIEQICSMESSYFSEYWYENAYNDITDYVHGVLDGNEIVVYQANGVTTDEILAANVMCRKNGQNIHDILDAVISGISIESQAKEIYGADDLPEYNNLLSMVTSLARETRLKNEPRLLGDNKESINADKDEVFKEVVADMINSEYERLSILEQKADLYADYYSLRNCGYPLNVQRALMNKGYTPGEIEQSADFVHMGYHNAVKKAREMMKNE